MSVMGLYRLSISGARVFSRGTTSVGTVAKDRNTWVLFYVIKWIKGHIPLMLRRKKSSEKLFPFAGVVLKGGE
jgi:hypothetical protein